MGEPELQKFDVQGLIYLKVEMCIFSALQKFDFQGLIYLKNEARVSIWKSVFSGPAFAPQSASKGPPWVTPF